jgi:hypothetical protein
MHVPAVPNLRGRLIYTYKFQRLFGPHFLTGHVHGTALNYTGFPDLVQVAAESECGASLHGHRKCSQAGCPLVNCYLRESALEDGYTLESPFPEKQRDSPDVYSHV